MTEEVEAIPGAQAAVAAAFAAGLPLAVASNSTRGELRAKLARLGLARYFGERVFTFEDVPRPKPFGDCPHARARARTRELA